MKTKDYLYECLSSNINCLTKTLLWGIFVVFLIGCLGGVGEVEIYLIIMLYAIMIGLLFNNIKRVFTYLTAPNDKFQYPLDPQYKLFTLILIIPGVFMAWLGPKGYFSPNIHWTISIALIVVPIIVFLLLSRKIVISADGIYLKSIFGKTEMKWSEITKAELHFAYRPSVILEGNGKRIVVSAWLKEWHLLVPEIVTHLPFTPKWFTDLVSNPDEIPNRNGNSLFEYHA